MNIISARGKRISLDVYCRILRSLANRPGTAHALSERFSMYGRTMGWILCSLWRAKLIHRREWVQLKPRARYVPVFAWGPDGDVEHKHWRPTGRKAGNTVSTISAIRDVLANGPMTKHQIAAELGFCSFHTLRCIKTMRDAGIAKIGDWEILHTGSHVQMYSFGLGPDAKRLPVGKTPERIAIYGQRHRAKRKHLQMLQVISGRPAVNDDEARAA